MDSQKQQTENKKISANSLSCYYGSSLAIKEVSLDIYEKKITAFIGPSGCGKSTMLRAINRMNDTIPGSKTTGEILINLVKQKTINVYKDKIDVIALRRKIGMVFQRPNPFPMSVFDNVAYGPRLFGIKNKSDLEEIVQQSLVYAALWNEVKDKLHNANGNDLSGGQQQRLCIARALAVGPEVLLLDEPCSALDPIATVKIEDLLIELKNHLTLVIVTHNMQQASRISDYSCLFWVNQKLKYGQLIEYKETQELFRNPEDKRTEGYITGRFG